MSKYDKLWSFISKAETDSFKMTFQEIEDAGDVPIDHSFLRYKKELEQYGYKVGKISMKEQTIIFEKI